MRTSGSCTIAWAIFTRCRMPFEIRRQATIVARIEVDLAQRSGGSHGRLGQSLQLGREPHELEGGQRLEQGVLLRYQADAVSQRELAVGILAEHAHGTLRGRRESGEHPQHRRFARAVGAEQAR